ncbi:non-ribosomal peptide synthetase, partial [Burkholderia sp. E168m22]
HNPDPLALGLSSHNLAYVIYTSGSTGTPKGVMNPHVGVVNRLLWGQHEYPLTSKDRVLQKTPFSFDPSVFEFFWPLLAGGQLVMARPGAHQDIDYLTQTLEQYGITVIHFVSSMLPLFIEKAKQQPLTTLERVIVGGDTLPYPVQQQFHTHLPDVMLLNLYGPTETAIEVTHWQCRPDSHIGTVPIGYPIANTQIYIVDQHMQPVPVNVVGEIYIGGIQVSRGYLNRPDLTAERFVPDSFIQEPGRRLYRTGDLGRWLPDGAIEYLGRNDFQVKIRGLRIELGEIETRLAECAGVQQCVVLVREDRQGDKRLVAYYVPQEGAAPSASALRAQLAEKLTEHMVPSAFVCLDALPFTPNGKLDRQRLPVPDLTSVATQVYVSPEGKTEQAVVQVWQNLLALERVGREDHFFELGGHSLLAIQVVSRLNELLDADIPLSELFTHPIVKNFAAAADRAPRARPSPIVPVDRSRPLPLSWAQQRLWFLDQLDHSISVAYHMSEGLRLRGHLDRAALQATFDRIVARHENLRTTFISSSDEPVQRIAPADVGFALQEEDLRALSEAERAYVIGQRCEAEVIQPFDLSEGPLMRARLLRLQDDDHLLLITQHHIVSDGWSVGLLIQEVIALYTAFCQGKQDPLPPLPIQYADYAAWQQQWLQGDVLQRQIDFWKDYLAGAPTLLQLPADRPRPAIQRHVGSRLPFALDAKTTAGLHSLSTRHGTTLFMTLLAGWAILLSRVSGQDDVVVGTPVANRQRAEIESLIGFFVNALALRVKLDGDPNVADLLARVKESSVAAYAHQDLPFEQVVEALQPPRSLSHNPLFQANLTLENVPTEQKLTLPGLDVETVELPHLTTQFDLALHLMERDDVIEGRFYYSSDLFDAATIERLAEQFQVLLQGMVDDDTQRVSRLPLLSTAERERILVSFNRTARAFPHEALIHQLFEEQVRLQPDAIAVIHEAHSISYAALNERANQIAHHLVGLGLRPDDRVAICVERSIDMVAGLLGILKAGACYVPLDPAYPAERLSHMLRDSAPAALLTQRALLDALPQHTVPVLLLDDPDAAAMLRAYPAHNPDPLTLGLSSHNLAYVIYTSGSTGTPKGVMVEHRGVLNLWLALENTVFGEVPDAMRVGQNAALSFDASVQAFLQLLSGRTMVLFPQAIRRDSAAFLEYLRKHKVEAFDCTPSQLEFLINDGVLGQDALNPKVILIGGEAIGDELWQRLASLRSTRVYNLYGPTECTVESVIAHVSRDGRKPHIGRPIANTQVYLLDGQGQPVPIGVTGEIHIGGVGLARGYLGQPE